MEFYNFLLFFGTDEKKISEMYPSGIYRWFHESRVCLIMTRTKHRKNGIDEVMVNFVLLMLY